MTVSRREQSTVHLSTSTVRAKDRLRSHERMIFVPVAFKNKIVTSVEVLITNT